MRTICGTIIDILVSFTMGKGIKPVLKLNTDNEDELHAMLPVKEGEGKEELKARIISENQYILDPIHAIDESFSDPKQTDRIWTRILMKR